MFGVLVYFLTLHSQTLENKFLRSNIRCTNLDRIPNEQINEKIHKQTKMEITSWEDLRDKNSQNGSKLRTPKHERFGKTIKKMELRAEQVEWPNAWKAEEEILLSSLPFLWGLGEQIFITHIYILTLDLFLNPLIPWSMDLID